MDGEVDVQTVVKEEVAPVSVETKEQQPSVEDLAAHDYKKLLPRFKEKLHPLSRRQIERVVSALMEYPFENNAPTFSYPEERTLFYIGMQIMDTQFILKKAVFEMMQDKGKLNEFNEELKKLQEKEKETNANVSG